ncbi:MAG TPA: hypothetical protein VGK27_06830 [Candidatus Deferrimicrobiaceae bacterium]|jgi:hypothetical protein
MLEYVFSNIEYYLPVFIPIFLTVLSVLSGILTGRIEKNFASVLKIHNDIVLGLFSFIIWALVSYQQTGLIKLNKDFSISFIRVIVLLFINFIAVIIGLILVNHKWHSNKNAPNDLEHQEHIGQPIIHKSTKSIKKENFFNGAFLLFTIFLVFLPLFIKVKTVEPKENRSKIDFRVAIPYYDESIAQQVGLARWGSRSLCELYDIKANDKKDAITQALQEFDRAGRNQQAYRHKNTSSQIVNIKNDYILCVPEE